MPPEPPPEAVERYFAHRRLVGFVLGRYAPSWARHNEDVRQAGELGLWQAALRFDAERGTTFATYAVPVILGAVRKEIRALSVRRPDGAAAIREAVARLEQQLGRSPTVGEIVAVTGLAEDAVVEAIGGAPLSLEALESPSWSPAAVVDEEAWAERDDLAAAVSRLKPDQQRLLAWRYRHGLRQVDVARRLGVSQAEVSRRERRALLALRQHLADAGRT